MAASKTAHAKKRSHHQTNGHRRQTKRKATKQGNQGVSGALSTAMDQTKGVAQGLRDTVASVLSGKIFTRNIEMEFESLRDLYRKELQDLYGAEKQLLNALPKMAEAASSQGLRKAFEDHLRETEGQVKRLEQVFEQLGMQPKGERCKAMEGLIAEGSDWMNKNAKPGVMDAGLIAAAQRVEHYEMAGYGCVRTYAQLLGDDKAAKLLQETLDEEGAADKKLTQLSKRINVSAEKDEERGADGKETRGRGKEGQRGKRRMQRA